MNRVTPGLLRPLVLASVFLASAALPAQNFENGLYAVFETSRGSFTARLEYEKAPLACISFAGLAEGNLGSLKGQDFYAGTTFFDVVPSFMIRGGDPTETGKGNAGYTFPGEFESGLVHDRPGTLSLAGAGPNRNGSQFFVTHIATPWLDGRNSVFGYVVAGQDVVNTIQKGDKLEAVRIVRVGFRAKAFKTDQQAFDAQLRETLGAQEKGNRDKLLAQEEEIRARWPRLQPIPDDISIDIVKAGSGPARPGSISKVYIKYKAMLPDGTLFDSTQFHGNMPFSFKRGSGEVILGLENAVNDMAKGEVRVVAIPPSLAYGANGAGRTVPPWSYLVFEIELVDIKN